MARCLPCSTLATPPTPTPCFQLRAAEVEIKDLQSEFQLEKIDYLATIRRQERDSMLFQQLLEQVQPLIRRDCNYSNLEKIRREACWDEDNGFWKIPEPIILKTSLPVGQVLGCPLGPPPRSVPSCGLTRRSRGPGLAGCGCSSHRGPWGSKTVGTRERRGVLWSQTDVGWNSCSTAPLCGLFGTQCPLSVLRHLL